MQRKWKEIIGAPPVKDKLPELKWWFPKIGGAIMGDPHNEDYSILGSVVGSLLNP